MNSKYRKEHDEFVVKLINDKTEDLDFCKDVITSEGLKDGDTLVYATTEQFREIKLIEGDFIRAWYIDENNEWGYEEFCCNQGMHYLAEVSFTHENALKDVGALYPAYNAPDGRHLCFEDFRDCAKVTFKRV